MKNRSFLYLLLALVALLFSFKVDNSTNEKSKAFFASAQSNNYSSDQSQPEALFSITEFEICESDFEIFPVTILTEANKFTISTNSDSEIIPVSYNEQYQSDNLYDLFCAWKHHLS